MKAIAVMMAVLFIGTACGAERPGGKQGERITKIEKDFAVKYDHVVKLSVADKVTDYWAFMKEDESIFLNGVAFCVPIMATDRQVEDALSSSMVAAAYYHFVFKKAQERSIPTPNAAPLPNGGAMICL